MLTQQFPEHLEYTMRFIVDDAKYILEKEERLNNR
jgi:hypothetical protein